MDFSDFLSFLVRDASRVLTCLMAFATAVPMAPAGGAVRT